MDRGVDLRRPRAGNLFAAVSTAPCWLAPVQAAMLREALRIDPTGASRGYGIAQLHMAIDEPLRVPELSRAFTLVARRHPALSSSLRWQGLERPEQRVARDVEIPVEVVNDWRDLDDSARTPLREAFLARDRARGLDLRVAPLMRLTIFPARTGATEAVWTFHQMMLDGRSLAPILRELFGAYQALVRDERWQPAPPPLPFQAFVEWTERLDHRSSLRHFRKLLDGKGVPTPLPGAEAESRPLAREGFGRAGQVIDPRVVQSARDLAQRTGTGLGTVLQASWALVLARFTGDDDVLFGSGRTGRRSALGGQTDSMIGLLANALPVRVRVDDERTVAALLSDLRAQRLSLRLHEHTPLEEIQGQCELPRDRPLFETLFTYDTQELNRTLRAGGDPRWSGRRFTLYEQPTLPLHITAVGAADRLELRALFDRARFRDSVVDRLLASFGATVDRLAQDEARPLGRIDVLPAGERDQLLRLWNDTARPFPDRLCLHEPFERRADRQPDAIAVETEAESLTYRALEERANRLAHLLRARGAGPGAYVGLCLDRGPELLVALLGILKSGSPYVALDPRYPAQRLAFMAADTGARLIVTERRHQALFPGTPKLVVDSDDAALELAAAPASRPERLSRAEDVCYAMFTSGSSGQPKAAALSHRAVMNTLDWVSRTFAVAPGDRLLFVTSPCFDLSVYDTLGVLGAGATVVVASQQMLADPVALAAALADRRITIWDSAPVALQRLLPFLPARTRESPLRLVLLSGDWIPLSLPDAVRSAFPSAEVQSLGGATEAAIWSNHFPIGAIDPDWTSIPYGRPIQNTRYHVLDAALRPVPIGVAGDLYIGGACLADGYVNRPELNAERFIPDPFAQPPGERLYLTGDRARYRHDGNLELLGRADLQVKIRGFRVEMGEVELALRAIPGVGQAVCAATAADAWGQRSLVAYLVPAAGATLDARSVREAVARQLPDFMVPSHVVVLPALPLSTNGKIDRRALPSPTTSPAPGREFVAPRTDLERRMIALWEDLLGRRPIGATDDFFELGGDSLLAVMLVSRVETGLGMALPLSTVLEHHTVETLVRALEAPTASTAPRRGPRRHLICLNAGGKGTPIVLLPGVGGHAFTFKDLPALLGREQPVYALSSIGAEAGTPLIDLTVEESAEIYEAEVLEAFPSGPIVVGGFSFGMLPAFELAHRLRQRGRSVPLMVSFDGFAPGYPRRMEGARRLLAHAGELLQSDPRRRGEYIEGQVAKLRVGLRRLLGKADETAPHLRFVDAEMRSRLQKVWDFNLRARDRYRPTHVAPDALLLIRCEIPMRWPATQMDCPMHGWYAFVRGPISVVTVPGEHLSLFAPENQQTIADTITQHLARYAPG